MSPADLNAVAGRGQESGAGPWLVVGLGNPGRSYAGHRHNVGHQVLQELAGRMRSTFRAHKRAAADVVEGRLGLAGPRLVLVRPRTYMNASGTPVAAAAGFYRTTVARLIVIHDELDLPFETLRVKLGGGDNGHNGLRSVRQAMGTGDFYRVRVGIGRPPGRQAPADYVLSDYSRTQREHLPLQVDRAADAVESLLTEGLERTQSRFNS